MYDVFENKGGYLHGNSHFMDESVFVYSVYPYLHPLHSYDFCTERKAPVLDWRYGHSAHPDLVQGSEYTL